MPARSRNFPVRHLRILAMHPAFALRAQDYIVAHGKLAEKDARRFMRQLASAVQHIHDCGVVHRDIKVSRQRCQLSQFVAPPYHTLQYLWLPAPLKVFTGQHLQCNHSAGQLHNTCVLIVGLDSGRLGGESSAGRGPQPEADRLWPEHVVCRGAAAEHAVRVARVQRPRAAGWQGVRQGGGRLEHVRMPYHPVHQPKLSIPSTGLPPTPTFSEGAAIPLRTVAFTLLSGIQIWPRVKSTRNTGHHSDALLCTRMITTSCADFWPLFCFACS